MSQNGASGFPILAKADFILTNPDLTPNMPLFYALHFKFSEPYVNGGEFDGEMTGSTTNTISLQATDGEINASNKDVCAAYIADRFGDPTFTAGDLRGGNVL
jgi:hypothetical protein